MTKRGETYQGIARSERGASAKLMSDPRVLDTWQRLTGLRVIPGTFNIGLARPFDTALLKYASAAELGWGDFDPSVYGLDNRSEVGVH